MRPLGYKLMLIINTHKKFFRRLKVKQGRLNVEHNPLDPPRLCYAVDKLSVYLTTQSQKSPSVKHYLHDKEQTV